MIKQFFSACILCLISLCFLQAQTAPKDAVEVPKSSIIEEMKKKKEQEPKISAEKFAEFGNLLIAKLGYDITFAPMGDFIVGDAEVESEDFYIYKLKQTNGAEKMFASNQHGSHPCGTWASLAMSTLTEKNFTISAKDKNYLISIPEGMIFDDIKLVDKKLKTVIRKWNTPLDSTPQAISKDGKTIYIYTEFDELSLGISDTGKMQFVSAKNPNLIRTNVDLKNFPKEEDNGYLAYKRFGKGKQTFTVKFSNPCT